MLMMNEMSSRENTKRGGPSVVARLMGMDALPPETGKTIHVKECSNGSSRQCISRAARCESTKVLNSFPSTSFKQSDDKSPLNWKQQYSRLSVKNPASTKPFQREHPQEEQLQKFKKEFEAWQESKLWEFSSNCHQNNSSEGLKIEQSLALKNLSMEKLAGYADIYTSVNKLEFNPNQLHGFQHDDNFDDLMPQTKDDMAVRRGPPSKSFEAASRAKFHEKRTAPRSPSRIVILKSFSDMNDEIKGPRGSLPKALEKGNSIEDLLEEVKERLKLELEGKGKSNSIRRLSAAHTTSPTHESLTDSKQFTWEVKKHDRENITADKETILRRSESVTASSKVGSASFWEHKKAVNESVPKHLWHGQVKSEPVDAESPSPPNLVRSFSVPVSRLSFEKALLKDHYATEVQKFQEHEASENNSAVNKSKKDGFSIKGKVSNLKRTLGLKGNFFGKKVSSIRESTIDTAHCLKPIQLMPFMVRSFGAMLENSTEVPPTPISLPCSPMSEHQSPVSPLEVPFVEDHSSLQVSGELSVTFPETKNQTEDAEGKIYGLETSPELHDNNEMTLIEDHGEAYVRDVLLLSGLYRAWPLDKVISSLDGQIKSIPSCVFVHMEEESYRKLGSNIDHDCSAIKFGNIVIDRRLLFDLVNQALPSVIDAPMNGLMLERRTWSLTQLPSGQNLLRDLLHQIQMYASPKVGKPQSVEDIVVWDMKLMPFCTASREDISSLGREVELAIVDDLIDELILDFSI